MPLPSTATWNRQPAGAEAAPFARGDVVLYGPAIGTEADFRLLGSVADRRVLDLGCGSGLATVAFAKQGARAIGLDFSADELASARRLSAREGVKVELHQGDLADLAFVRADTVDLVFSAHALSLVEDVNRVFRQVHRVLKEGAPLVFSVPHPAYAMIDDGDPEQPLLIRRSYFDRARIDFETDRVPFFGHHHTVADLFGGLSRANFGVDVILEPEPRPESMGAPQWRDTFEWVPRTLIMRARKLGI